MQLKKWLSLDDAANYLSALLSAPVEPKDVLQFALENHLGLSINFTKVMNVMEVVISPFSEITTEHSLDNFGHVNFEDKSYHVSTSPQLIKIDGVWDLKIFGGGEDYLKARLLNFLEESPQPHHTSSNIYIERDSKTYCLYEKHSDYDENNSLLILDAFLENIIKIENIGLDDGYYKPMSTIPSHAFLVVSRSSLNEFEQKIQEANMQPDNIENKAVEKKLDPRLHTTLLIIIAALAKKIGIDIDGDIDSALNVQKINGLITDIGFTFKDETIKSRLAEIPEAMRKRSKDGQGRPPKPYKNNNTN